MALLYRADLNPTKDEMRNACLKDRPWSAGLGTLRTVASYRFDDPDGHVGLESALMTNDDGVIAHVPLTYRGAPLEGADEHLVGTMEHSVLGTRWIYDACGDPVWNTALLRAITQGESGATQYFDGEAEPFDPGMTVQGSGSVHLPAPTDGSVLSCVDGESTTVVRTPAATLTLVRIVGETVDAHDTLVGTWEERSALLAGLTVTP